MSALVQVGAWSRRWTHCGSKYALEAIADAYRFELLPFGIDSILIEPGIYRTPIFERITPPADGDRLAQYGGAAEFAERVLGVFQGAIAAPDNPGSDEVAEALVRLVVGRAELDSVDRAVTCGPTTW